MTKSREKNKKIVEGILQGLNGLSYIEASKALEEATRTLNKNTRIDIVKQLEQKYSETRISN